MVGLRSQISEIVKKKISNRYLLAIYFGAFRVINNFEGDAT
jgi:hypothetical protein